MKTLIQQLKEVGERRVNAAYVAYEQAIDQLANKLAVQAFYERWPENDPDTMIVRKVLECFKRPQHCWVDTDEPGIDLQAKNFVCEACGTASTILVDVNRLAQEVCLREYWSGSKAGKTLVCGGPLKVEGP